MELEAFRPQSKLVTRITRLEKPRFPAIDAHNHLGGDFGGGWDQKPLAQLLDLLDQAGICASSGSACTSGSLEPSHVLRAMGIPFTFAHGSIRMSLSRYNTDEDVDYTIATLPGIIQRLRSISPFTRENPAAEA